MTLDLFAPAPAAGAGSAPAITITVHGTPGGAL
jgi:hypothetical protein